MAKTETLVRACGLRNRRPRRGLFLMAGTALLAGGCGRVNVSTGVQPDGSWTRIVKFTGSKPDKDGNTMGTKMEDVFILPAGPLWKIHKDTSGENMVITAERSMHAGETLKRDIVIKGGKKAPADGQVFDTVTVRAAGPGRWEYREVLHWQGDRPAELTDLDPDIIRSIKAALPPDLATDANAKDTADAVIHAYWRALFGPGDPLLSELLMHPDLAERRFTQRVGVATMSTLETKFGDKMTEDQRRALTRKLVGTMMAQAQTKSKAASPGNTTNQDNQDNSMLVAMLFAVKMPGKIVTTNGTVDIVNGDVFWGLYPDAAALGDVEMTAVCETSRQSASR